MPPRQRARGRAAAAAPAAEESSDSEPEQQQQPRQPGTTLFIQTMGGRSSRNKATIAVVWFLATACGLYSISMSGFGGLSSTPATATATAKISEEKRKSSQQLESFSPIGGWSSPHQVDCKSFIDETDEVYKQTSTEPSFMMNIHKPSEDEVSRIIWEKGCWECDHIKAVTKALSQYKNSYFLDIGGNIGMWSLSAAAANYQTVTIEALPDNYRRFCLSVNKNVFHNRTHLLRVAATEQPAAFRFHKSRNNFGGTRVVPIDSNEYILKDDKDIVQGVTVDSLNLPTQQPVVLKLDVEGHELSVLSGANHFLQNSNIVYAMMELRPGLHKDPRWKSIFQVLYSKGLKPYRINYEDETALDIDRLNEWIHFKHPIVRYFDVVWRLSDFVPPDA